MTAMKKQRWQIPADVAHAAAKAAAERLPKDATGRMDLVEVPYSEPGLFSDDYIVRFGTHAAAGVWWWCAMEVRYSFSGSRAEPYVFDHSACRR